MKIYLSDNKQIIYIAGKISGLPIEEAYEHFNNAENVLINCGFDVINPMKIESPASNWHDAKKICIRHLLYADAIYLLRDWQDSKGAKIEKQIAEAIGLEIIEEGSFDEIK